MTDNFLSNLLVTCSIVNEISHQETVGESKLNQSFLAKYWRGQDNDTPTK